MAKNDFLAKQRALQHGHFIAGLQSGRQQIIDCVSLALRDPEIMGKDIFGKDRLLKVVNGVWKYIDLYQKRGKRTMKPTIIGRNLMQHLRRLMVKDCMTAFYNVMSLRRNSIIKRGNGNEN